MSGTIKVIVALAILIGLLVHSGVGDVSRQLVAAHWTMLAVALGLMIVETLARARAWRVVLRSAETSPGLFRALWGCYLSSSFAGILIPSSAGTDVVRALMAWKRLGGRLSGYAASLLMLNLVTLLAGCLLAVTAIVLLARGGALPGQLKILFWIFLSMAILLPLVYAAIRRQRRLWVIGLRLLLRRAYGLRRPMRRLINATLEAGAGFGQAARAVAASGTAVLLNALGLAAIGAAIDITIPLPAWVIMPPLLAVSGLLPLSVMGFGVNQAAIVVFLALFGVPAPAALTLGMLNSALWLLIIVLAGGCAFLIGGGPVSARKDHSSALQ